MWGPAVLPTLHVFPMETFPRAFPCRFASFGDSPDSWLDEKRKGILLYLFFFCVLPRPRQCPAGRKDGSWGTID